MFEHLYEISYTDIQIKGLHLVINTFTILMPHNFKKLLKIFKNLLDGFEKGFITATMIACVRVVKGAPDHESRK